MRVAPVETSFPFVSVHLLNVTGRPRVAHPGRLARGLTALVCVMNQAIYAAAATPFAAPEQVAPTSSTGGLLRVVVALLVVLGAVIVAARLARRVRGLSGGTNSVLEVLGQLPLGTRERAVLIRVGERQLLIGVAPGNVRTLHVFDDLVVPATTRGPANSPVAELATLNRASFKAMLLKSLGK